MTTWKRVWTKSNTQIHFKDTLSVWDAGSNRYERFSNGTEFSWSVVDRTITDTGFSETLEMAPLSETPTGTVWKESIPVFIETPNRFHIPGWTISLQKCHPALTAPRN